MSKFNNASDVKYIIVNGLTVLQKYSWLLDSYVLDYYTEKHWEKLPLSWQLTLYNTEPQELYDLLNQSNINKTYKRVWPLSLLAMSKASTLLSLPRDQTHFSYSGTYAEHMQAVGGYKEKSNTFVSEGFNCTNQNNTDIEAKSAPSIKNERCGISISDVKRDTDQIKHDEAPEVSPCMTNPKLGYVFNKHVKPKKRHEISKMAEITASTAQKLGCQYVVDVGSGLGHLARMLAYGYGLKVCCLEAQEPLSRQARKLDSQLETSVSKHLSPSEMADLHQPVHLSLTLTPGADPSYFLQALEGAFGMKRHSSLQFGIVGLHPCGDLAAILLDLFAQCPGACFINIVGCCYMKLTTRNSSFQGYPLSYFVSSLSHRLSYESREIACHAIDTYCNRLERGEYSELKVHCYRAALEKILMKRWPHLHHTGIHSVKHNALGNFREYCMEAVKRLDITLLDEDLDSTETKDNLAQWKMVVTFYTLRLLLAPLVETILLLDRLLFLWERGIDGVLMPVFDPLLSPRNHILIATKKSTQR